MNTKTIITFTAILVAGLSAIAVRAEEKIQVGIDATSAAITETYRTLGEARLGLGATRGDVLHALGQPTFKLTPNGWVYENIQASRADTSAMPYSALVVVFNDHGAVSYRLVTERLLVQLEEDVRTGARQAMAVAASRPAPR